MTNTQNNASILQQNKYSALSALRDDNQLDPSYAEAPDNAIYNSQPVNSDLVRNIVSQDNYVSSSAPQRFMVSVGTAVFPPATLESQNATPGTRPLNTPSLIPLTLLLPPP